ncbi:MAG: F0F1 ATP synthase subunit epsilon [Betaproteobacteria bacterium TMED156]|nr:MAG: F0F1 ATP synthase subunit epsilon [Betaproteobacteria bacterium TMED156]
MNNNLKLEVVSAHDSIFSGQVLFVVVPGEDGELGIYPKHTPLITRIKPGTLKYKDIEGNEKFLVVAGGVLEVQPDLVTVLADTVIRAEGIDKERSLEAKRNAENLIQKGSIGDIDLAKAHAELAFAIAELSAIEKYRGKK